MDYFELHVAGLTRQLPICKVNDEISFAAFVMFGDVELTERVAEELLKKCPEFDVIVTAEAKGIPLAYAMARMSGKTYIPARKAPKLYMHDPIAIEVKSISDRRRCHQHRRLAPCPGRPGQQGRRQHRRKSFRARGRRRDEARRYHLSRRAPDHRERLRRYHQVILTKQEAQDICASFCVL